MIEDRKPGRPKKPDAKVAVSLRLSPDVLEALKALGPGWQAMTDGMLREAVRRRHLPADAAPKFARAAKVETAETAIPDAPVTSDKPFWSNLKKR